MRFIDWCSDLEIFELCLYINRSQRPHGLRCRFTAALLLRLWVRIPPVARMSVCCECCVLSGSGLRDGLSTRPEESYRLMCVVLCYLETSRMRMYSSALNSRATRKIQVYIKTDIYLNTTRSFGMFATNNREHSVFSFSFCSLVQEAM